MIAFIVLDEDSTNRDLSLKERDVFTYRKD